MWWIRLGIYPELIEPAHPEQNGRHERMHRTLKAEATRPPSGNLQAQQTRLNRFRAEYKGHRPHRALGLVPLAAVCSALIRGSDSGVRVHRRDRLGGLLREYTLAA